MPDVQQRTVELHELALHEFCGFKGKFVGLQNGVHFSLVLRVLFILLVLVIYFGICMNFVESKVDVLDLIGRLTQLDFQ